MFKATMYWYNEDSWSQGDYTPSLSVLVETKELGYEFINKYFEKNKPYIKNYSSGFGSIYGEIETYEPNLIKSSTEIDLLLNNQESIFIQYEKERFYDQILLPGATK